MLPEAEGPVTTLTEKVYVPVKEHPDVSIQAKWRHLFTSLIHEWNFAHINKTRLVLNLIVAKTSEGRTKNAHTICHKTLIYNLNTRIKSPSIGSRAFFVPQSD